MGDVPVKSRPTGLDIYTKAESLGIQCLKYFQKCALLCLYLNTLNS